MAKDKVAVLMDAEVGAMLANMLKVSNRVQKLEEDFKGVTAESKKLTKEQKEFGRETKRALDEIRGPQQRYEQRTRALHALLKQKKITQEQFNAALRRSKERYDSAGRAGQKAFGPGALGQVQSYAMGFLSLSGLIAGATKALNDHYEALNEVVAKQREAAPFVGMLAQLSAGDPKQQAALERAAVKIYKGGGARSQAEAMQVAFQLQSAEILKSAEFMTRASVVAGPEGIGGLIGAVGTLQEAFGKPEVGTPKQMLSKAAAGAGPVPRVGMMEILEGTAKAGGAGKAMQLSDEEVFAMVSLTAGVYGAERGSTAVARMLDQLSVKRPELKGKTAKEIIQTLRAEKMSEAELQTLLGIRGIKAYRLSTPEKLESRLGLIEKGQREGIIEKEIETAMGRPRVAIPRTGQKMEAGVEEALTPEAQMLAISKSVKDLSQAEYIKMGADPIARGLSRLFMWMEERIGEEGFIKKEMRYLERRAMAHKDEELLEKLEEINTNLKLWHETHDRPQPPVVENN